MITTNRFCDSFQKENVKQMLKRYGIKNPSFSSHVVVIDKHFFDCSYEMLNLELEPEEEVLFLLKITDRDRKLFLELEEDYSNVR